MNDVAIFRCKVTKKLGKYGILGKKLQVHTASHSLKSSIFAPLKPYIHDMYMKNIITAALFICASSAALHAQTEVTPFVPGSTLEGVSYFLPKTAFRITVMADKTVTRPGELYKYADRFLRIQDVPTEESTQWKLKKVILEPYGVPDKTKAYSIKVKSKTVAPLVGLSKDGILLSINTDAEEETLPELPAAVPAKKPTDPRTYMTQEMLTAGSTAKVAELCAQEIYDIRESRNALVRGEADNTPKDGAQLQLMLDQLDLQANTLSSLFKGTTETSTEVFCFDFTPDKETDQSILFRFSSKLGPVDADDLAGYPVYVSVKNTETVPATVMDAQTAKKKEKMEKGVYYNVPSKAKITVYTLSDELTSLETPMGQFGVVEILSSTLFDKNATTKVTFFQSTGGTKDVME